MKMTWLGALALLFIGLKLGGVIGWSWWWVTAPLWGGLAILLGILAAAMALPLIVISAALIGVFVLSSFKGVSKMFTRLTRKGKV